MVAGILGPNAAKNLTPGLDDIKQLLDLLTDPVPPPPAIPADLLVRLKLKDDLDPGQFLRQGLATAFPELMGSIWITSPFSLTQTAVTAGHQPVEQATPQVADLLQQDTGFLAMDFSLASDLILKIDALPLDDEAVLQGNLDIFIFMED